MYIIASEPCLLYLSICNFWKKKKKGYILSKDDKNEYSCPIQNVKAVD